ncbi:MAG: GNAT family N-acetyltransferase [Bacteroidetes bacterium]|nr:GNAT family N-acetyltransferase [Bacteroidota bacterium]MBS1935825.1 GNAT family N-acetyltransferase [Bacteroidota bacterium]
MKEALTTPRLVIEALHVSDAGFIKQLLNTEGWLQNIGNRNINTIKDAEAYIQKILGNKNYNYHIVRLKENYSPIGVVTFIKRENHQYPDIGFAFLPEYSGKGYAYEASKIFLDNLLKEQNCENIIAITLRTNAKSVRLLEKLGLKFNKTFKENGEHLLLYSLSDLDK